jgi:hypothetical protein
MIIQEVARPKVVMIVSAPNMHACPLTLNPIPRLLLPNQVSHQIEHESPSITHSPMRDGDGDGDDEGVRSLPQVAFKQGPVPKLQKI